MDGSPTVPAGGRAQFRQVILSLRWGAAAIGLALASPRILDGDLAIVAAASAVILIATMRTMRPVAHDTRPRRLALQVGAEAALVCAVVATTGYFASPFAFSLLAPVAVAGFLGGFSTSAAAAAVSAAVIGCPMQWSSTDIVADQRTVGQWTIQMLLVGLVAAYARRITQEVTERDGRAAETMAALHDANELLVRLHHVAQEIPESLDLDGVVATMIDRLRDLVALDTVTVLLREPSDDSWRVVGRHGGAGPDSYGPGHLPGSIAAASTHAEPIILDPLAGADGLSDSAQHGIYAILRARGTVVGAIGLERAGEASFADQDLEVVGHFADPAALAIDNARWFARLRAVGADEERTRIARDLHDRVGQSLAYMAFEIDRISKRGAHGTDIVDDLRDLRRYLRTAVGEVRETLQDLRSEPSRDRSMAETIGEFADRVQARSGIEVHRTVSVDGPPRPTEERELWRIAQEAMANTERHSGATNLWIEWSAGVDALALVVRDDGVGFDGPPRPDCFGILGMRERASALGATFELHSAPGRGATVRVSVARTSPGAHNGDGSWITSPRHGGSELPPSRLTSPGSPGPR